jgi:protein-histidine N-methyltransferase
MSSFSASRAFASKSSPALCFLSSVQARDRARSKRTKQRFVYRSRSLNSLNVSNSQQQEQQQQEQQQQQTEEQGKREKEQKGTNCVVPGRTTNVSLGQARELAAWLRHDKNVKDINDAMTIQPGEKKNDLDCEFTLARNVENGEVILRIPQECCVTAVDAKDNPIVCKLIEDKTEIVQLALWVCYEKAKSEGSEWWPYLKTLSGNPNSVLRFTEDDFKVLLRGTSIEKEARARRESALEEYKAFREQIESDPEQFPLDVYAFLTENAFIDALDIVCARAQWLNSANCYALVPLMDAIPICGAPPPVSPDDPKAGQFYEMRDIRKGTTTIRCGYADYDVDSASVVLCANTSASAGSKIVQIDHSVRNNSDLYLSFGDVDDAHPGDYEYWPAKLSGNDPLYDAKKAVLEAQGFSDKDQKFPVYKDRMPREFLSYLRFARVTNSEELFACSFTEDKIISPMNEYETLQLLMADCRDRMSAYETNEEDELLLQKRDDVSLKVRNASRLRKCEKELVGEMMNAVRRRLAPIRGIPTKKGMEDPNSDLLEIFEAIESIPNAPKKAFENFQKWARGDFEADVGKKSGGGGCG